MKEPFRGAVADDPRFEMPTDPQLHAVVRDVREERAVTDEAFDAIYPLRIRELSSRHWTPVAVARCAARMLVRGPETRVLDVGSGAGKFCLVGALTTRARFFGVEQRGHLVELARAIAARYGARSAEYIRGDIADLDWSAFDAFYFFNPFAENHFGPMQRIDSSVELAPGRYQRDLALSFERLAQARTGTRVVTYHGVGGALPPAYELSAFEPAGTDVLEEWTKVRS